jgi:hypothetical protein
MTPRLAYDSGRGYTAGARFEASTSRPRSREYDHPASAYANYPSSRDYAYAGGYAGGYGHGGGYGYGGGYSARDRAYSDPQKPHSPTAPKQRALSDARPFAAQTRPPNSLERFVRADDPAAQNPLRRLVGRVCGVTPQRATELYLRREEESDRGELPAYGTPAGVIMPPGMGLDLDFDIESQGTRLAHNLDRGGLGRSDHLHAARA